MKTLQVVYKIVERCNINCTYCYYFNMDDKSAYDRPFYASVETSLSLAESIENACIVNNFKKVKISFHGGEPMMIKPEIFDKICEVFSEKLNPIVLLEFGIQTNAVLISEEWILLFLKYKVIIGVSIDGYREAHDRYRLSKNGKSTFDITERNLLSLIELSNQGLCCKPSTISVIDPLNDYEKVYNYLRSIGVTEMAFLLPDRNFDQTKLTNPEEIKKYGKSLFQLFTAWLKEDNPDIYIRHIQEKLNYFGKPYSFWNSDNIDLSEKRTRIIIARSDGTIALDDSYYPAQPWYSLTPIYKVRKNAITDFLNHPVYQHINYIENDICDECNNCKWKIICRGGDIENRYSKDNGFDNPSYYCEGYKYYYENLCKILVDNSMPLDGIPIYSY